mgnify:CR=1 FL=1
MIDLKTAMGIGLATFGSDYIRKGASYLYQESGLKDSFLGTTIDRFTSNETLSRAVTGIAEQAIKSGISPDFTKVPTESGVNLNLGKVSKIGTTPDFDPFTPKSNLLFTGKNGAVEKALSRTGVQEFAMREVGSGNVVKSLGYGRKIRTPTKTLSIGPLKKGQIESAR